MILCLQLITHSKDKLFLFQLLNKFTRALFEIISHYSNGIARNERRSVCVYIHTKPYSLFSGLKFMRLAVSIGAEQQSEIYVHIYVCEAPKLERKTIIHDSQSARGSKTDFCCTQNRCSGESGTHRGNTSRVNNLKRLQAAQKFLSQQHT